MLVNSFSNNDRLTEQQLAEYWNVKRNTLQKWRCFGIGPVYIKIGGKVVYTMESIRNFELTRTYQGSAQRISPDKKDGE